MGVPVFTYSIPVDVLRLVHVPVSPIWGRCDGDGLWGLVVGVGVGVAHQPPVVVVVLAPQVLLRGTPHSHGDPVS